MKRLLKYMLVGFLAGAAIGNLIALFTGDLYSPELLNRVGGNPTASDISGINVKLVSIMCYVISGFTFTDVIKTGTSL